MFEPFSDRLRTVDCNLPPFFFFSFVDHGEKLHDVPDEYLVDTLTIAKKIAIAQGAGNYNILQVWFYSHPVFSRFPITAPP